MIFWLLFSLAYYWSVFFQPDNSWLFAFFAIAEADFLIAILDGFLIFRIRLISHSSLYYLLFAFARYLAFFIVITLVITASHLSLSRFSVFDYFVDVDCISFFAFQLVFIAIDIFATVIGLRHQLAFIISDISRRLFSLSHYH